MVTDKDRLLDTGNVLHVSPGKRKEVDEPGSYGLDESTGDDTQNIEEIYTNPGKIKDLFGGEG